MAENNEIFKPIFGFEKMYSISNLGNVRIENTRIPSNFGKIKKCSISNSGYLRVHLSINKKRLYKTFFIHRLVAYHFLGNLNGKEYVNHKDGNRLNNDVENLEWCTPKENTQHHIKNNPQWHKELKKRAWDNRHKTLKQYKYGTQFK